jgi:hypothetical protein
MSMTLEISYKTEPVTGFELEPRSFAMELKDFEVKVDGKVCPTGLRDIILAGLEHLANLSDRTFSEVLDQYLEPKIGKTP